LKENDMLLNLNDPTSIVNWWKVWPARHNDYLDFQLAVMPQFSRAIREAKRRIASNAELQNLLAASVQETQGQIARQTARETPKSSIQLRWQELTTAA
jgi:hypothetical protein